LIFELKSKFKNQNSKIELESSMPERQLQCVVVTPEKAVLDAPAEFVALPMYDGELGVLPGRAPLIGRLGYGELRIQQGPDTKRYFVDGGFAQIRANVVTVLTARAMKGEDINLAAAQQALDASKQPGATPELQEQQQKAQERARSQIRVSQRAKGQTAPVH
jgi:F-type H+-transporting ATPase subunit epsilon